MIFFSVPIYAGEEGAKTPAQLCKEIRVRHRRIQTEITVFNSFSALRRFATATMRRAADRIPESMVLPLLLSSSVSFFLIFGYMISGKDAPLAC